ncbi:MAG: sugar transferase [Chloroflexi bacterium]|nr:sugar transferase [Chloroflexota bacterium]
MDEVLSVWLSIFLAAFFVFGGGWLAFVAAFWVAGVPLSDLWRQSPERFNPRLRPGPVRMVAWAYRQGAHLAQKFAAESGGEPSAIGIPQGSTGKVQKLAEKSAGKFAKVVIKFALEICLVVVAAPLLILAASAPLERWDLRPEGGLWHIAAVGSLAVLGAGALATKIEIDRRTGEWKRLKGETPDEWGDESALVAGDAKPALLQEWEAKLGHELLDSETRRRLRGDFAGLARNRPREAAWVFLELLRRHQWEAAELNRKSLSRFIVDNLLGLLHEILSDPAGSFLQDFFGFIGYYGENIGIKVDRAPSSARTYGGALNHGVDYWEIPDRIAMVFRHLNCATPRIPVFLKEKVVDKLLSLLVLLVSLPLFAIVYLLIRSDGHPVLFSSPRLGQYGREFIYHRFRIPNRKEHSGESTQRTVPTWVGTILLATGMDRLPSFVNVLLGQMSLVGPAPTYYFIFGRQGFPEMVTRLIAKPGIFSDAQYTAAHEHPRDKDEKDPSACDIYIRMDIEYVRRYMRGWPVLAEDARLLAKWSLALLAAWVSPKMPEEYPGWVYVFGEEF